jgi:TonB family protein
MKRALAFVLRLILLLAAVTGAAAATAHAQPAKGAAAAPKLTRAPKLVKFVEAPYPEAEKAAGKSASVVLRLGITAEGKVSDVAVAESAGAAFDEAATSAARQFVTGRPRSAFSIATSSCCGKRSP